MSTAIEAPYGSWKSPITSELVVADSVRFAQTARDGDDIYWSEMRPNEGGRYVIVRRTPAGDIQSITPEPFNARTRVHEYGGGAWLVDQGVVFFANFQDQRLYRQELNGTPQPLTPQTARPAGYRYADGVVDRRRERIICVREDHTALDNDTGQEAINTIVALDMQSATRNAEGGVVLAAGHDFYAAPRLSPDGTQLVWIAWNHPHMPWTTTELWLASVQDDGTLSDARCIAGGDDESVSQPRWSPAGTLYFVSDRNDWWNLYRWQADAVEPVVEMAAEFDHAQWRFDAPTYGFASADTVVCCYVQNGVSRLGMVDMTAAAAQRTVTPLDLPYTEFGDLRVAQDYALFVAGSPTSANALVRLDLHTHETEVVRQSSRVRVDERYLSAPRALEFPTAEGQTAHAFYYAPRNDDFVAPAATKPPLIVISHGGPTGATSSNFTLSIQYWTSRGFGVLDVNYGGSTGYGRAYRARLHGRWGIVDVDDCVNGAQYLADVGKVDPERLIIRGGSAGGYTTLAALAYRHVFNAGASYYGVSDLEALAKETHKFESRYLNSLIGPYPAQRERYIARSPIHHTDQLSCPVIFFQGLEDKVVLPNQSEMMVEALREKGVPVAYVPFAGEQHGFRQAQNMQRALDAELYFYARVFGLDRAESVEPVEIANLQEDSSGHTDG